MSTYTQEFPSTNQTSHFIPVLKALVVGGLVGAGAMLLLAPQSGRKTRARIQKKTLDLRDRTTETVKDAIDQVKSKGNQIKSDVLERTDDFQHQGQDVLIEQLDRIVAAAEASKKALKKSKK